MFMEQALNNIIRILKFFIKILFKERKRDKIEVYKIFDDECIFLFYREGILEEIREEISSSTKGLFNCLPGKIRLIEN